SRHGGSFAVEFGAVWANHGPLLAKLYVSPETVVERRFSRFGCAFAPAFGRVEPTHAAMKPRHVWGTRHPALLAIPYLRSTYNSHTPLWQLSVPLRMSRAFDPCGVHPSAFARWTSVFPAEVALDGTSSGE